MAAGVGPPVDNETQPRADCGRISRHHQASRRRDPVSEVSTRSARLAVARWLEPKIALGILLVVASVVLGARVFASADRYAEVLVARHPLVPGEHLLASDLGTGRVRFDGRGENYVAARSLPIGYVVTRYVGAGELVPAAALSAQQAAVTDSRLVSLPVAAGNASLDLARGDLVDVYVSAKDPAAAKGGLPALVLSAVAVEDISGADALGDGDTEAVVLDVPTRSVPTVVSAGETGAIDLVRLPDPAAEAVRLPQ